MSFFLNTLSTVLAAGITAALGFLFRDRIRKAFLGKRLYPKEMIPCILVKGEALCNCEGQKIFLVTVENTGSIPIADIQFFIARNSIKRNSLIISYIDVPISYRSNWSNDGNGERMQLEIPSNRLIGYGDDNYRLFVQFSGTDGTVYRTTYYLLENKTLQKQITIRAAKPLPKRTIKANDAGTISSLQRKYSLDLSVG